MPVFPGQSSFSSSLDFKSVSSPVIFMDHSASMLNIGFYSLLNIGFYSLA